MKCVECGRLIQTPTSDPFRCVACRVTRATFGELDRFSIRTGCETELNRHADAELRRRGYAFEANHQRWA